MYIKFEQAFPIKLANYGYITSQMYRIIYNLAFAGKCGTQYLVAHQP
jgi:hypothetical protein